MNIIANNLNKAKKHLGFSDGFLTLIGILLLAYILPLIFFKKGLDEGLMNYCPHWFIGVLYTSVYWFGDRAIMIHFRKRYPTLKDNRKRVIRQSLVILTYTLAASMVLSQIELVIVEYFSLEAPEHSALAGLGASLFATLAVVSLYEALYYISQWKLSLAETEQLKREQVQSQLASLRNQVNPHFLFNSLNTLASLIPEDPDKALVFVQKLSQVYRYILELGDRELIKLKEEMEAVHAYNFLLSTRFGDNLRIVSEIPEPSMELYVVPLAVQMLIENAVKHNVISSKRPLFISIRINSKGDLELSNNLQLKDQIQPGTGTGLSNISDRYRIISGKIPEYGPTAQHFIVTLPLLQVDE